MEPSHVELSFLVAAALSCEAPDTEVTPESLNRCAHECGVKDVPHDIQHLPHVLASLSKERRKEFCVHRINELLKHEAAVRDLHDAHAALVEPNATNNAHTTSLISRALSSLSNSFHHKKPPVETPEAHLVTSAHTTPELPSSFPADLPKPAKIHFENWSRQISGLTFWCFVPANGEHVVKATNWAASCGWRLRAKGVMHNWSPLCVSQEDAGRPVLLVDTQALNRVTVNKEARTVDAECGASLEALLTDLEKASLSFVHTPAPGVLTVGGMLTIGAHGSAIPAVGEKAHEGGTFGSFSNAVLSMRVVAWNGHEYALRTVARSEPDARGFLVHLGRSFVISATFQVTPNYLLRCVSSFDTRVDELFAATKGPKSFAAHLDQAGRAEAIWFPYHDFPWLKVWSVLDAPSKSGRHVTHPYNYPLTDHIPDWLERIVERVGDNPKLTKFFGKLQFFAGSLAAKDIWGESKNLLLYIRPNTLRVSVGGGAVLTTRANIQAVIHAWTSEYWRLLNTRPYSDYPLNAPVEIRCCGLDQLLEVALPGGAAPQPALLSPLSLTRDYDVVLWMNVSTIPISAKMQVFMNAVESFMRTHFHGGDGSIALYRPEWAKGWGWSDSAPYANNDTLDKYIPGAYPAWNAALEILDRNDPKRVFSNAFLDRFLRPHDAPAAAAKDVHASAAKEPAKPSSGDGLHHEHSHSSHSSHSSHDHEHHHHDRHEQASS